MMGMPTQDYLIVPGTEVMADIDVAHAYLKHTTGRSHSMLIPQPSDNSNDPLNWSRKWKLVTMTLQGIFVLLSVLTNLSIAPLTPIYMELWNKSVSQIALLTGVCVLSLGYANFVIVPGAELYGRRIVSIVCAVICVTGNIWQATARSYESFLGARVFVGLGAAANESIMTMVIADVFFLHERGRYMCFYFFCYFNGTFLGPIISGNVAARVSWRWFFWAATIAQAINLLGIVVLFPETRYRRSTVASREPEKQDNCLSTDKPADKSVETISDESVNSALDTEAAHIATVGNGKPSKDQFSILQPLDRDALKTVVRHVLTPLELFFFPIVFWAAMTMGGAANTVLDVNLLQSQALTGPAYNFDPGSVGFANFALVVGGMVGLATAGPSCDWIASSLTKRNGGIREPEMRLWSLIPYLFLTVIGMTVVGVGFQSGWPWEAVIIIGFSLVGLIGISIPTIAVTYAVDCYKPVAGQIMVVSTVVKNTFGFGMTYYVNDWAAKNGFIPPAMLLMAITVGFGMVGMILLILFGKKMRRWTRNSQVHSFE
jgi:MFS family permease